MKVSEGFEYSLAGPVPQNGPGPAGARGRSRIRLAGSQGGLAIDAVVDRPGAAFEEYCPDFCAYLTGLEAIACAPAAPCTTRPRTLAQCDVRSF